MTEKREYCNAKCIKETSDELMIPSMLVKKVEKHWQLFTKKKIESGTFENIRIPFLVKFEFREQKAKYLAYILGVHETNKSLKDTL